MINFLIGHPYFTANLFLVPLWLLLFTVRKESRKEMLIIGKYLGFSALILSSVSLRDYWHPVYIFEHFRIEDFLYGFLFGGICAEVAKIFFKGRYRHHHRRLLFLIFTVIVSYILLKVGVSTLRINSTYVMCIVLLVIGLCCYYIDRKVLPLQITSGMLAMVITFVVFKITLLTIDSDFVYNTWKLHNLSGVLISGIPIEEYLFAFLLGFGGSSYYETYEGADVTSTKLRFI